MNFQMPFIDHSPHIYTEKEVKRNRLQKLKNRAQQNRWGKKMNSDNCFNNL